MAQVRLVQIGTATPGTNIQIGTIGRTLTAAPAGTNIQLGKFNNTTGTFYKDPTNPSAGGAGQQIQVGTNIANRTLGYITGQGVPSVTIIPTNATGAGYFSIWNAGAVQGGFQIQIPTCTGQQIKAIGSQSNQPAVNQAIQQPVKNQSVQTAAKNQTVQQAAKNQSFQQPLNQYAGAYYPPNYYAGNHVAPYDQPGFYNDNTYYPGVHIPGYDQPPSYNPAVYQAPFNQPLVNQSVQQPLVNQTVQQAAINQSIQQAAVNQSLQQAAVITPSTNQPATGTLYNGSWVNTTPGTAQNAAGFVLTIQNIGTLTTQGGAFSGTGAGGSFQAPNTYIKTTSASVSTQQGVVNFQTTTRN